MRRKASLGAVGLGALGLWASCAGELEGDPSAYRVARAANCDAVAVFTEHCATEFCHGSGAKAGGLDLGATNLGAQLVGVGSHSSGCESRVLVDPAAVDQSFLLEKLEKKSPECGSQMPLTGEITSADLACIRSFVTDLARGGGDAAATPLEGGLGAPPDAARGAGDGS